jgi:hypothetical protein
MSFSPTHAELATYKFPESRRNSETGPPSVPETHIPPPAAAPADIQVELDAETIELDMDDIGIEATATPRKEPSPASATNRSSPAQQSIAAPKIESRSPAVAPSQNSKQDDVTRKAGGSNGTPASTPEKRKGAEQTSAFSTTADDRGHVTTPTSTTAAPPPPGVSPVSTKSTTTATVPPKPGTASSAPPPPATTTSAKATTTPNAVLGQYRTPAANPPAPAPAQRAPAPLVVDERSERTLEEEMAEWDDATARTEAKQAEDAKNPVVLIAPPIGFPEAYNTIRQEQKSSWEPYLTPELKRVGDNVSVGGFWGCMWSCFHTDIKENTPDYSERDYLLCLQNVAFDHTNKIHRRILLTLYRRFIKPKRSDPDVPTIGTHWEKLGFQGDNPATDLRSTGMVGLLHLLYLVDATPHFADALWRSASNPMTAFNLAIVSFNFSGVAMEVLKDRSLHDAIAKRRTMKKNEKIERDKKAKESKAREEEEKERRQRLKIEYSDTDVTQNQASFGCDDIGKLWEDIVVGEVVGDFYVGLMFEFYQEWQKQPSRGIADFPPIKAKLRPYARENPDKILKNFDKAVFRQTFATPKQDVTTDKKKLQFDEF